MKIKTPTLVINKAKVNSNIERMIEKIDGDTIFRPHMKTHQSAEIGEILRNMGVSKITVSSVSMAKYFAKHEWSNITIAFPVNILELDDINELSAKIELNLLLESSQIALELNKQLKNNTGIFIKIDTGYNRTGLTYDDIEIENILDIISNSHKMTFKGFLTHAGNTYNAKGVNEILSIMDESKTILNNLKEKYIPQYPDIIISYGDTPSCSLTKNFDGFDEIRPGNFTYYDVMQYHIGSCSLDHIAVAVACPVVAVHEKRQELVIYGGAIHLSKEFISADNDFKLFGYLVKFNNDGWSKPIAGAYVKSLSQEHGIISLQKKEIARITPGDTLGVLPIHSCLTANLLTNNFLII